ncbi:MAG: PRC-barrel domain-containing protein [Clostridia bacterium]
MLRFSTVIGLPVVSIKSGTKIAVVKDIIFDANTKKLVGLVVHCKKLMFNNKIILIEDIMSAGINAILIEDEDILISSEKLTQLPNTKKYWEEFIGTPVYSDNGVNIGEIQDVSFDWELGLLEELEISDGVVQDLIEGRKILPALESIELEQGIVIIDTHNMNQLKNSGKGIKKFLLEGSNEDGKK